MAHHIKSIHELRMLKYKELLKEFANRPDELRQPERGRLQRFGAFAGISERYLSHINNLRKNIGDDTARKLELAFNKPKHWMDAGQPAAADPGEAIIIGLAVRAWKIDPVAAHNALLDVIARQ